MTDPVNEGISRARPEVVELRRVRVPLVEPIRAAHGTETSRCSVIVRARSSEGEGWGECVALERPSYTSEWHDGAWLVLRDMLAPAAVRGVDAEVRGHPMASAAIEMACVDLALRSTGAALADALGAVAGAGTIDRRRIESRAVLGGGGDIDGLLEAVDARLRAAHRCVKVKISPTWGLDALGAVRRTWPDLDLAADANGSFDLRAHADVLGRLDTLGLTYLEQPLAPPDLVGHARLRERLDTPIALDESATSAEIVDAACRLGALDLVNVKAARLGGLGPTLAVHQQIDAHGRSGFCGGMYELGLGRAVALAVATLPCLAAPADLGPSTSYVAVDLTDAVELDADGTLAVPAGPGFGRVPDLDRLEEMTVERCLIERS